MVKITLETRCEEACPCIKLGQISLASVLDWTKFGKMIITLLIDIDNLNLSKIWTFVVIDDKGGEVIHKDKERKIWREDKIKIGGEKRQR